MGLFLYGNFPAFPVDFVEKLFHSRLGNTQMECRQMKRLLIATVALTLVLGLASCGRGGKQTTTVTTTTTGQQLIDLQKALDDGAVTQKEYDRKRKEILKDQ